MASRSAVRLLRYILYPLVLALAAYAYPALAILPVFFAPLGHVLVILWGRWLEQRREPVFHGEEGGMVLSVYPGSPAEQMWLQAGDVIKSVNGIAVENLSQLVTEISPWAVDPGFVVENQFRLPRRREILFRGKVPPLGIIPAPLPLQGSYVRLREGFFQCLWKRWRANGR